MFFIDDKSVNRVHEPKKDPHRSELDTGPRGCLQSQENDGSIDYFAESSSVCVVGMYRLATITGPTSSRLTRFSETNGLTMTAATAASESLDFSGSAASFVVCGFSMTMGAAVGPAAEIGGGP